MQRPSVRKPGTAGLVTAAVIGLLLGGCSSDEPAATPSASPEPTPTPTLVAEFHSGFARSVSDSIPYAVTQGFDMRTLGYGYAIIGAVGPSRFYERTVGATPIPDSEPGVYAGLLKPK